MSLKPFLLAFAACMSTATRGESLSSTPDGDALEIPTPMQAGYTADITVTIDRRGWHGRLIQLNDGSLALEHLDEPIRIRVATLIHRKCHITLKCDTRLDPARH